MIIVSWNAEGFRAKQVELQRWLTTVRADVVAIQEAQLPKVATGLAGYQPRWWCAVREAEQQARR